MLVDELDELESAADDVVVVFEDDVGENDWTSEMATKKTMNFMQNFFDLLPSCNETDNWK
jgi:hypothetical protein